MLMHKGMAKQRLMRLIKLKKVLVREDFWQLSQKFLVLEERLNLCPGKKINLPYAEAQGMSHCKISP